MIFDHILGQQMFWSPSLCYPGRTNVSQHWYRPIGCKHSPKIPDLHFFSSTLLSNDVVQEHWKPCHTSRYIEYILIHYMSLIKRLTFCQDRDLSVTLYKGIYIACLILWVHVNVLLKTRKNWLKTWKLTKYW